MRTRTSENRKSLRTSKKAGLRSLSYHGWKVLARVLLLVPVEISENDGENDCKETRNEQYFSEKVTPPPSLHDLRLRVDIFPKSKAGVP